MKTVEEQLKIILKGVSMLVDEKELRSKLEDSVKDNKPLIIKLGLDPSAPDIHLGHAVVLRKIKQMQELGHKAVIIIGDFTGKIGDPTGKAKGRNALSDEQVKENAGTYFEQIFKVLDKEKTTVHYNSEWLSKLNFEDVLKLASTTTIARMLERDDFRNRFSDNVPIGIHEFFYPLMQAYDSVALNADMELGGTDQTFNILMGRKLQKSMGQSQQIAMFMPLLEGLDGEEKMSKSLGNYIGIYEPAEIMFKKVMEIPDKLILRYFELATDEHLEQIEAVRHELNQGRNPRDVKYSLAEIITRLYHTEDDVIKAKEYYDAAFGRNVIPDNIPEIYIEAGSTVAEIIPILVEKGFVSSNGEFRRLIQQGGVQINQEKLKDLNTAVAERDVLKIGKKRFVRFIKN